MALSYWFCSDTYNSDTDNGGSSCSDYFYATIRDSAGNVIGTVQTQCDATATNGWVQYAFDVTSALSAYSGQQVQVSFEGTTTASTMSHFYVDDVTLNDTHS